MVPVGVPDTVDTQPSRQRLASLVPVSTLLTVSWLTPLMTSSIEPVVF